MAFVFMAYGGKSEIGEKAIIRGGVLAHNLSGHYEISPQFLVFKNDPKPNFSARFPVEISTESQNKLIFGQIMTYPFEKVIRYL